MALFKKSSINLPIKWNTYFNDTVLFSGDDSSPKHSSDSTLDTMWGIYFTGLWCLGTHPPAHGRLPPDALVLYMCGSYFSSAVHIRNKVRLQLNKSVNVFPWNIRTNCDVQLCFLGTWYIHTSLSAHRNGRRVPSCGKLRYPSAKQIAIHPESVKKGNISPKHDQPLAFFKPKSVSFALFLNAFQLIFNRVFFLIPCSKRSVTDGTS